MKNFTQLTDCLTIVAAAFGRVCSTGLENKDSYRFAFAPDGVANYVCAVDYIGGDIKVYIFIDWLVLDAIDASQKMAAFYHKTIDKTYRLGGELSAAGFCVEYK